MAQAAVGALVRNDTGVALHCVGRCPKPVTVQAVQQSISIPAGPLTPALNRLAAQASLQILFDANLAQGKTTRGVRGNLTPAQALDALLAGTGLTARFSGANQVVLSANAALSNTGAIASNGGFVLDAITIYGARDATTLESTTASVGIVTAEEIKRGQIATIQDSFRRLGNVADNAFLDSGFAIRGLSSEGFVPSNSLVGSLYIDGVLQTLNGARRGARSLWDVEQVEVYRGPQSTLSGRAAMAGAIYVKTKDPTFTNEGEISGTVGSHNRVGTALMLNTTALEDQVALRFAGSFDRFKSELNYPDYAGYSRYRDITTDLNYSLRGKMLIAPKEMPNTKALLSYSYSHDSPLTREIFSNAAISFREKRGDLYRFPSWAEVRTTKVHNASLQVTHDFSDNLRFTSISALHHSHNARPSVNEGTPGEANVTIGNQYDTLFTQEVRLNYEGGPWKWVAGLYGSHQHYDTLVSTRVAAIRAYGETLDRKTANLAAFGEATYEFHPTWYFTVGGRADYSRIGASIFSWSETAGFYTDDTYPAKFNEFNFVPKIGLSKDLAEGHKLGFTYTQGFRTGGYYINYRTLKPAYYDPEKSHAYELSYKGRFLNDKLRVNANLFFNKYQNQQIEIRPDINDPFYRETSNAASSQSWGFEIEPAWQVTDQFSAFVSLGYLNTKFLKFDHASYGDLSGKPWPEAPEWTVGFGGHYSFDNGFYVSADAKFTSRYLARFGTDPQDQIDSRIIVNAQTGYRKDNWEINAFVENLFDVRYYTVTDMEAFPNAYAQLGKGRILGLNVKARF